MIRIPGLALVFTAFVGCASAPKVSLTQIQESERSAVCCVHHASMKKKPTRILYGFTVVPSGAADVERSYFPFAQRRVSHGHVLPSIDGPFFDEIFVCDDCNAAKAHWIRRHPDDRRTQWWKDDIEEPNKAPEPTPRPVTIPAEPGIAPGRVVAHL